MPTRIELLSAEVVGPNPSPFNTPFTIRVVLNVLEDPPKHPVDVKFTWSPIWDFPVDQELDELEAGPFSTVGKHDMTLECDPPNLAEVPDPTGPTALMVSLLYGGHEFLHLGFNVETTCTLQETPEVYTDGSVLMRRIGRCFRKTTDIAWDAPAEAGLLNHNDLTALAAQAPPDAEGSSGDATCSSSDDDDDDDEAATASDPTGNLAAPPAGGEPHSKRARVER